MQEMRSLVNEDVRRKLDGVCEMYRVDVRGLMLNFRESRQVLERDMRDVVSAADSRLIDNNERNNQKENVLGLLNEAVQGLGEELEESRNSNQQLHEKQRGRNKEWKKKEIGRM